MVILTDGDGRPFERPESPAPDAPIEERIAYIRAVHRFNDAVTDCANKAFSKAFSERLRRG